MPALPLHALPQALLTFAMTQPVFAQDIHDQQKNAAVVLDTIKVTEEYTDLTDATRHQIQRIPGAGNVVDLAQTDQGRRGSTADILAYQPGINAQSPGNEGTKVSIRGSGINRAPGAHASGISVSLDGLPLTFSGGTPYELLEPLWMSRAEVLRGANGFDRGALALGGAINYVSRSGLDSPGLALSYETGRYGYRKRSLSYGNDTGDLDYYATYTESDYGGYQHHAAGEGRGAMANLGWQITPDLQTRFYFRYRQTAHDTPGRLTRAQIRENPRQANPAFVALEARRPQPGSTWIGNRTTLNIDADSTLEAGLVYHKFPMDLNESLYRQQLDYEDINATLDYQRRHTLLGLSSITTVGLRATHDLQADVHETLRFANNGYPPGTHTRDFRHRGTESVLHASNDLSLTPKLHLISGLALIHTRSEIAVTWPASGGRITKNNWDYAPRFGMTWQATSELQLFGNLSRSVEPAHPWSMIWGSSTYFPANNGASAGRQSDPVALDHQTASTLELGARGNAALGRWELTAYSAWLRHALLSVEIQPAPDLIVAESNASPTVHRGLEAGLESTLWRADAGMLTLRQAYTFSDFRYRNDVRFGANRMPGLPRHFYQAELRYAHPTGLYAAINTEYASKMAADYANSFYTDSRVILGSRLGFDAPNGRWQGWLEARNLTDRHYAATVTPGYNDDGGDAARSTPGEGFGVSAGVRLHFE